MEEDATASGKTRKRSRSQRESLKQMEEEATPSVKTRKRSRNQRESSRNTEEETTASANARKRTRNQRKSPKNIEEATISAKAEKCSKNEPKIFNDPIWGPIKLHPVCVKIIDTPEFQRLRYVKQLGGCSFVYPGACHTRFEHSIGTSHLAGLLVRTLKENMNPAYKITIDEKDILCVEIAGLCHDLGHGPFSHLFDMMFIPRIDEKADWTHEKASINMLDRILDKIVPDLKKSGEAIELNLEEGSSGRTFIKDLIHGEEKVDIGLKNFLYEIVANEENKIDVDKWDYFSRDCHMLGLNHNFQIMRSIMLARVIKHGDGYHISFPKSEYMNIFDMYHTRYTLHRCAYQHPVNKAVELMITDALVLANDKLKYRVGDGKEEKKLSETIYHMDAYTLVTDAVIDRIRFENFKDKDFQKAKEIIDRIFSRDLYRCEKKNGMERRATKFSPKKTKVGLRKKSKGGGIREDENKINQLIKKGDIHIEPVDFSYGAKGKNPMNKVHFYSGSAPAKPDDEKSVMLPKAFQETYLRMYWKKSSEEGKEEAKRRFKNLKELTLKGKRYIFNQKRTTALR